MIAVIMAGGKGTRLQTLSKSIPKPMFAISGKPILEYQIESLKKSNIIDIIIVVGYLKEIIMDYFKDGSPWNVHIQYIVEESPLGSAGAFCYLKDKINDDFFLIFGDLIFDIDFNRFMAFHKEHKGLITLFGHPNSHPYDSDLLIVNPDHSVKQILSKHDKRDFYYHNFVNAGLYCINPKVCESFEIPKKVDLEEDIIRTCIPNHRVFAYHSTEYVKDAGTPDRLDVIFQDIKNNIVTARNLKNKQKAVFLDRDGTINELVGFLKSSKEFRLTATAAKAIRKLNESEYLVIVITNQPVIARGEATIDELNIIHNKMETLLGKEKAYLDAIFYCPHHPDKGFEGEVSSLKIECSCRKPKTGLLEKAVRQFNIELSESWFIGDSTVDIQTGINGGLNTILVHTGECGKDNKYHVKATKEAMNLLEAVESILNS